MLQCWCFNSRTQTPWLQWPLHGLSTPSLGLRFLGREEVSLWQAAMLFYLQQLPLPRCVFKYFCKSHILCFAPSKNSAESLDSCCLPAGYPVKRFRVPSALTSLSALAAIINTLPTPQLCSIYRRWITLQSLKPAKNWFPMSPQRVSL